MMKSQVAGHKKCVVNVFFYKLAFVLLLNCYYISEPQK